ncbi:short chain dehydrogenase [Bordetella ansorpii]|uniref:Short chain dehydrogenase n=1 Tax=Bordetella ansorpii TaxID=288768 RepID=A0A157SMI7_9BORD|nr:SDR family oxidoreductase [Bordetella ansorpii]SAI71501.1 short chain dehydrogenase [Bordetella ansorpii]
MTHSSSHETGPSILLIGASRGLGFAMSAEFLKRGWNVVGTVRGNARTELHDLADAHQDRVEIEPLDVTEQVQIAALRDRLSGRRFDILFVNAGTANTNQHETIADVTTEEFVRVMVTNALAPMRVIEALQDLVPADGLIGIMSSGQGSIASNEKGGHEVYRGSKSALNQYMRSYAARHAGEQRALLLLAPGWIRTALGGPEAPSGLEETIPDIVSVLLSKRGKPGLEYLDRMGRTVPW